MTLRGRSDRRVAYAPYRRVVVHGLAAGVGAAGVALGAFLAAVYVGEALARVERQRYWQAMGRALSGKL